MPFTTEDAQCAHELTVASDWIAEIAPSLPSAEVWSKNELFWRRDNYDWDFTAEEYDVGLVLVRRQLLNQRMFGRAIGKLMGGVPRNIPHTSAVLSWEDGFAEEWSFTDIYHPTLRVRKTRWDYVPSLAELRKYKRTFYEEDKLGLLLPTQEEIDRLKKVLEIGKTTCQTMLEQGLNNGEA